MRRDYWMQSLNTVTGRRDGQQLHPSVNLEEMVNKGRFALFLLMF